MKSGVFIRRPYRGFPSLGFFCPGFLEKQTGTGQKPGTRPPRYFFKPTCSWNPPEKALDNILMIVALVVFFFVVLNMLDFLGLFSFLSFLSALFPGRLFISPAAFSGMAKGFFEITAGCLTLSSSPLPLSEKLAALSFVLGFSGFASISRP
jgi:hypothetical protein